MKLGFVGTGTITAAIVHGLGANFSGTIHVSPRNAQIAAALAAEFPHVRIAPSNQAVLDNSDIVFLAVRPQVSREIVGQLVFRPDHHVISLIATFALETLKTLVAPASRIAKAVPLPFVATGGGATAIYPPDPVAADLFNRMGQAVEVATPAAFDALTSVTAIMGGYFLYVDAIVSWLEKSDIPATDARRYAASILNELARTTLRAPQTDLATLATDHATKGGLNEQFMLRLQGKGVFQSIDAGLSEILNRVRGTP